MTDQLRNPHSATRDRIVEAARGLFSEQGLTSRRDPSASRLHYTSPVSLVPDAIRQLLDNGADSASAWRDLHQALIKHWQTNEAFHDQVDIYEFTTLAQIRKLAP